MSIFAFICIGIGGAFGALARAVLSKWLQDRSPINFPLGVMLVNIISCFIAGVFLQLSFGNLFALTMTMGFLGGFSTLSTVNFESIELMFSGRIGTGIANLLLTYVVALVSAACGFAACGLFI